MESAVIFIDRIVDETSEISVRGYFNESVVFPETNEISSSVLLFDMEHLKGINSVGISRWIDWTKSLGAEKVFRFKFCNRNFLNTANIVNNFLPPNSEIESVYVPYFCEACDLNTELFFETRMLTYSPESKKPLEVPDTAECRKCKEIAEIDIVKSLYFSFLKPE